MFVKILILSESFIESFNRVICSLNEFNFFYIACISPTHISSSLELFIVTISLFTTYLQFCFRLSFLLFPPFFKLCILLVSLSFAKFYIPNPSLILLLCFFNFWHVSNVDLYFQKKIILFFILSRLILTSTK